MQRLLIFAPLLLAACGDKEPTDTAAGGYDPSLTGDSANGATVYATHCASCHGASGEGGFGPAMADEVPGLDDEGLWNLVREGISNEGMPAFDTDTIGQQELADLVAYAQETWGG